MTVPVTTGGKNLTMRANPGATMSPIAEATSTAPKTSGRPSPPARIAVIVATPANDTPWTRGSWEPKNGTPHDCRIVARPPMNRHDAMSTLMPASSRPAALPMMRGTAMMPPYIVRTCCRPYANDVPTGSRSSSGRCVLCLDCLDTDIVFSIEFLFAPRNGRARTCWPVAEGGAVRECVSAPPWNEGSHREPGLRLEGIGSLYCFR